MSAATQAFLSLAFGLFITGQFSKFAKPQTILDTNLLFQLALIFIISAVPLVIIDMIKDYKKRNNIQ